MEFWPLKEVFSGEGMPLLRVLGLPDNMAAKCQEIKMAAQEVKAEVHGICDLALKVTLRHFCHTLR